jgi:hypothetical protein
MLVGAKLLTYLDEAFAAISEYKTQYQNTYTAKKGSKIKAVICEQL